MENWDIKQCKINDGLWITPSLANHSCSDFIAYRWFEVDFVSVRAVTDIQCGDENSFHILCRNFHTEIG